MKLLIESELHKLRNFFLKKWIIPKMAKSPKDWN